MDRSQRSSRRASVQISGSYVALDRSEEERWEYVDGEVFVVESRPEHNLVKGKLYVALTRALEGKPCLAFPDGQKVAPPKTRAYPYPDASVFCGEVTRDAVDDHALTNPTLRARFKVADLWIDLDRLASP